MWKIIKNPIEGFYEENCSQPITIVPGKELFNIRRITGDGAAAGVCDLLSKVLISTHKSFIK